MLKKYINISPRIFSSSNFVDKLKEKWFKYAPDFWWGDRLDSRFLAVKLLKNIRGKTVLDLGCNAGIVLSEMDSSNFSFGLDKSKDALRIAKTLSINSKLLCADMLSLPFKDNSFDVVVLLGMLELPGQSLKKNAIYEVHRILRIGGQLFLTTQNRSYLRARKNSNYVSYAELQLLLDGLFTSEIRGFNPLPEYPYFLPNRIFAKTPFIWMFLIFLMEISIFKKISKSFLVYAEKI